MKSVSGAIDRWMDLNDDDDRSTWGIKEMDSTKRQSGAEILRRGGH